MVPMAHPRRTLPKVAFGPLTGTGVCASDLSSRTLDKKLRAVKSFAVALCAIVQEPFVGGWVADGPVMRAARIRETAGVAATQVLTPSGETWTVCRRWLPKRKVHWRGRPLRRRDRPTDVRHVGLHVVDLFDVLDLFESPLVVLFVLVLLGAMAIVTWLYVIPMLLVFTDMVGVAALAALGVAGRLVLHRPWQIEATGPTQRVSWSVVGWKRGTRTIKLVAERLARGEIPPTDPKLFPLPVLEAEG